MMNHKARAVRTIAGLVVAIAAGWLSFSASAQAREDPPPNTLTAAEKAEGWKLLFDGKSTAGWRTYRGGKVGDGWQVVDGALALDSSKGKQGGDIVTVDQFDNFELVFEWKVAKGSNSGVMYRVTEDNAAPYFSGPEYQILDNHGHPDGKSPLTAAGSAYAVYAPAKDVTRPVGEWNQAKIIVNGNHVEHWLNGEKIVSYELGSADWLKRIKNSKWKDVPTYGKAPKGHIDLQDHGDKVTFRSIKIRPLTAGK